MALAQPLVLGHAEEWALVRRHESEKMFGVQLAGGYANRMVPAAEMVRKEIGEGVDFVDINLVSLPATCITRSEGLVRDARLIWYSTKEQGALVSRQKLMRDELIDASDGVARTVR